jgi:hypothetical protein
LGFGTSFPKGSFGKLDKRDKYRYCNALREITLLPKFHSCDRVLLKYQKMKKRRTRLMEVQPIRDTKKILAIRKILRANGANGLRDETLFIMGINTALRVSDLLSLLARQSRRSRQRRQKNPHLPLESTPNPLRRRQVCGTLGYRNSLPQKNLRVSRVSKNRRKPGTGAETVESRIEFRHLAIHRHSSAYPMSCPSTWVAPSALLSSPWINDAFISADWISAMLGS